MNTREFNLTEVEHLAWEGFEVVTPERWASLVKHVREKVEDHYWEVDGLAEHYSVVLVSSPSISVGDPMMILMRSPVPLTGVNY